MMIITLHHSDTFLVVAFDVVAVPAAFDDRLAPSSHMPQRAICHVKSANYRKLICPI